MYTIFRYPNVYGIDMPTYGELVAYNRTDEEVAEAIGADMVLYQDLNDLIESCRQFNPQIESFDVSVFNGEYVTGDVTQEYLEMLEEERHKKKQKDELDEVIGLYNHK